MGLIMKSFTERSKKENEKTFVFWSCPVYILLTGPQEGNVPALISCYFPDKQENFPVSLEPFLALNSR